MKTTKMPLLNMYLTIGGVKIRVLGYTAEIFSHCGPTQPCGASLPYIIMALEGGNSTEAT